MYKLVTQQVNTEDAIIFFHAQQESLLTILLSHCMALLKYNNTDVIQYKLTTSGNNDCNVTSIIVCVKIEFHTMIIELGR